MDNNRISLKRGKMETLAAAIIKSRYVIFVVFAIMAFFCSFTVGKVKTNSDLTAFLPSDSETKQGLSIMEDEFDSFSSCQVMLEGISFEDAQNLSTEISKIKNVAAVQFDDTSSHYKDRSAMFSVTFDTAGSDPGVEKAINRIEKISKPYKTYISTDSTGNYSKKLSDEMGFVITVAVLVILAVLLFTSRSYFELIIFAAVFLSAGLMNMGTNYLLGTISSITNSVAVILQLALAIDYAIIFMHRYADESSREPDKKEALIRALSKSIVEISSSSLTTIAGLAALTMMRFRLGYDLGFVLMKGIVCSMLTVFLLMPGLVYVFAKPIEKTTHRNFVPKINFWGKLLAKKIPVFLIIFALIVPASVFLSSKTDFAFSGEKVTDIISSDSRTAMHKINDTFDPDTSMVVLVPGGDYEKEKVILEKVSDLPDIKIANGIANIEISAGMTLTDRYTKEKFAVLFGIDDKSSERLFSAYALEHNMLGSMLKKEELELPLIDILSYLIEKIDQGLVPLSNEQSAVLSEKRGMVEKVVSQLKGKTHDRLILTASVTAEGEKSTKLLKDVRSIAEEQYGEGKVYITGQITSAADLRDSYKSDSVLISVLSIAFVFMILLFTFKSPVTAALLVFVIQGSIWINFSVTYLKGDSPAFVTNMIVSAIQMGATVDYAIVMTSRYKALREHYDKREAMIRAVNECFPTVLTSGLMLTLAGMLIAFNVSDVYVGHIGLAVGRGAAISVVLVLTALPQLLILFDKLMQKTTLKIKKKDT